MRKVAWVDSSGVRHVSIIRDNDPDSMAEYGISCDPPDLASLDWVAMEESLTGKGLRFEPDKIKATLHDALLARGLASWNDVLKQQTGITAAVHTAAVMLYTVPEHQKIFISTIRSMVSRLYRSAS